MKGLLLDTHVWLWSQNEPHLLPASMLKLIEANRNDLWISPVSVWELILLISKGRYALNHAIHSTQDEWILSAMEGLKQAPLTVEIVISSSGLTLHKDPADRFLAATAQTLGLTLLTVDERLIEASEQYGEFKVARLKRQSQATARKGKRRN